MARSMLAHFAIPVVGVAEAESRHNRHGETRLSFAVSKTIATIWYALIFGKLWRKLTGLSNMKPEPARIVLVFIGLLVLSVVLWRSIVFGNAYFKMAGTAGGLMGGFFGWPGYIAPVTRSTKLYEKKPWGLWLPDNAFRLLSLLVMGIILSVWMSGVETGGDNRTDIRSGDAPYLDG